MDDKLIQQADRDLAGWSNPAARLRDALEKDELVLYCQPIVALAGAERFPMGEVLVRLREEESAMLPPGEFLPVFEHYGMMPQLDRWVVMRVLRRLAQGSKVPRLSVNLSGQTLLDDAFLADFFAAAQAHAVDPKSVVFEIDEPDYLARAQAVSQFAAAARQAGAGILVDGFGRKSVSFLPLQAVPVDFLKVDGSIVRKLPSSEAARNKTKAIVRVAQALGFQVIGECVEDQDVLGWLKALDVGYAQGFGIYQPQPIDRLVG